MDHKFSQVFRNKEIIWQLKSDLLVSNDRLILFTPDDNKMEIVNLDTMIVYSMNFPFPVESILIASEEKWLIQSNSKKKYLLVKSLSDNPCPNVLKEIEETPLEIGDFLSCGKESLREDHLSNALKQNIDSPNRILVSDNSFATIIVGFPELDSANDVYHWPRDKRMRNSAQPIIADRGQIVRTISSNFVPKDIFSNGNKAYFEIVDTFNHKVRYLPIPQ